MTHRLAHRSPRVVALLALIAAAVPLACAGPEPVTEIDHETVSGEVRSAFLDFKKHLNEGDFDSALTFYADDPRFAAYEDGAKRYGSFDEIREVYGQLASYGPARFDYSEPEITVLGENVAVLATEFSTSFGPSDAPSFEFSGALTAVVERLEDGWAMLIIHSSTLPSAPAYGTTAAA